MGKSLALIIAMISVGAPTSAGAEVLTPPGTWTFNGSVVVEKVPIPPLLCNVTVTLTVPNDAPDGHGIFPHRDGISSSDLTLASGEPICASLMINSNPHAADVASVSGTTIVTIEDVHLSTIIAESCHGDVEVEFENNPDLLKVDVVVPEYPSGPDPCTIIGSAALSGPVDVDIAP